MADAPSQTQTQGSGSFQNQSQTQGAQAQYRFADLLNGYAPEGYDEAFDVSGLRPHWRGIVGHIDRLGALGLTARREQAYRLIRDNGATFNANAERGVDRPWTLDPLPVVLPQEEWRSLARGVAQRARLLDAILADCYGPQRLLREGLMHPAAMLSHPQFLRPLHQVPVPRRLTVYACDLVRGQDGRWQVTAEHTQAPSGTGYALENRIVLARALADAYRDSQVERVASYFLSLRKTLRALSPGRHDDPRIVLLTPGPYAETYFEHAYLSRYLGYPLVEGGDLTVRDDKLYLKNLGGLHRVDVVLRRLADDFCDPLELRSDSVLGISGLAGAVRAGNVVVANALGAGLGENGALLPLGDRLSRHLLGEELRLPAVPTVWNDAETLIAGFDRYAIRATAGVRGAPIHAEELDEDARDKLAARIRLSPQAWIGQERVQPSTVPVWTGQGFQPRPFTLRAFAVADADEPDGFAVMPGGLGRAGDTSKDVWVIAPGPVSPVSLLQPATAPVELKRGGADLPSRVADNLFWLGRYAERAEGLARLVREGLRLQADGSDAEPVLGLLDQLTLRPEGDQLTLLIEETALPGLLDDLKRSAFAVRDRLSNDAWRLINRLSRSVLSEDAIAHLDRLLVELCALSGMGMENATRGPAWRFLDLGRRIERMQYTIDLLRGMTGNPAVLETLLAVMDSTITYRHRYLTNLQPTPVLDLLLIDGTNPRSVAFQFARITDHLATVPGAEDLVLPTEAQRIARRLRTEIDLADPEALCRGSRRAELGEFLARIAGDANRLSDVVTSLYLSHAVPTPTFR